MTKKSLGICIGASTVSAVILNKEFNSINIESKINITHNGNPKKVLSKIFSGEIPNKIAVTGKKFRNYLNLTSIPEAESVELALDFMKIKTDIVISAGGENFIVYVLDKSNKISKISTGNKCASGTGEFFLQQIGRMNLDVEEAIIYGESGEPYNISGRCSVFCKSDCTHALNKGVAKENVVAGLSKMMAQKITELTSKIPHNNALMIGGTSQNRAMVKYLREQLNDLFIPEEAPYFEALGAAIFAMQNETKILDQQNLFSENHSAFSFHKSLKEFSHLVKFEEFKNEIPKENDECILGLDVGSTTTKAILLRINDNAILASEYLRTNGDPVQASIDCYKSLKDQINVPVKISGLGVTGSGRHISGLHALTEGVINEIIAHATAAVHFDKDVDTIFEIGGQDAKYTFITAGVASDYAMNEACSAGTGSFLEEAAKESLNINYKEIGEIALTAKTPPNFNDQCAAFISSDIKNALHEGLSKEDIVAGLVYSICMNYNNRVKGNRPVGKKVFMQGGVCYNKAVPVAMAALTGKEIIVPPQPGLMGAFGVALEIKNRINLGLIEKTNFNLTELIDRKVNYDKSFICAGGAEKCDRKCSISLIRIDDKKYPFGGACDKYYNIQIDSKKKKNEIDYVKLRQELVFEKYINEIPLPVNAATIGISKSFLANTFYPLYYNFFTQLGFKIILGDNPNQKGIEKKTAAFCYPVELAHGFFQDLIDKDPDYIFMPHITEIFEPQEKEPSKTCVLLQSEFYYLKSTFKNEIDKRKILSPVLNFSKGFSEVKNEFVKLAVQLRKVKKDAEFAFDFALEQYQKMISEFKELGKQAISELEKDKSKFAVVLFGRAYNSFVKEANLGIPQKFSSRGVSIIPHDFLSAEEFQSYDHMYWGAGKQILRTARFVKDHSQLFGTYITNFSCGPDSFIISYFRNNMAEKPSLTLELDSHSADAGINTRIEAALDIIKSYREISSGKENEILLNGFRPLKIKSEIKFTDSDGNELSVFDKNVKMILPSMGNIGSEAFAAAFRHIGINAEALPIYNSITLLKGRGNSSCKECLPLILNAGSLLEYYENKKAENEKTLFFMAKGEGPCRLGQYHIFLDDLISQKKLRNFGIYTLSDENSYEGLGNKFTMRGWNAVAISDVLKNIYNAIQALAVDKEKANSIFEIELKKILISIEKDSQKDLYKQLEKSAKELAKIERKESIEEAKKVILTGEIFVRHDEFSRVDLIEKLSAKGFVVKVVPIGEYIYYSNYLAAQENDIYSSKLLQKMKFKIRDFMQIKIERKIKEALCKSGFVDFEMIKVDEVISKASHLIKPELTGEAILTVGSSLKEIMTDVCGVISIGPFGCMPARVAESILTNEMNIEGKEKAEQKNIENFEIDELPFLAIETDGNVYPQIIQSKIEVFMLQAERLHEKLMNGGYEKKEYIKEIFTKLISSYEKEKELPAPVPQYNEIE